MRYFYYWLESSFAGGCLGQSNEILQTSDTSENSLIDMTLLRSSDGNGDASNVTMKDGWELLIIIVMLILLLNF